MALDVVGLNDSSENGKGSVPERKGQGEGVCSTVPRLSSLGEGNKGRMNLTWEKLMQGKQQFWECMEKTVRIVLVILNLRDQQSL